MAGIYIAACLVVILVNVTAVPEDQLVRHQVITIGDFSALRLRW